MTDYGLWEDVTSLYSPRLRGLAGMAPAAPYGAPYYFNQPPVITPHQAVEGAHESEAAKAILREQAVARKLAAAAVATAGFITLPDGSTGSGPYPVVIDGTTNNGNATLAQPTMTANTESRVNTYTQAAGYKGLLDPEDPTQNVLLCPFDSVPNFIDCSIRIAVFSPALPDGKTVFQNISRVFRPDQQFAASDRASRVWRARTIVPASNEVRTFVTLPNGAATTTFSSANSIIGHRYTQYELA